MIFTEWAGLNKGQERSNSADFLTTREKHCYKWKGVGLMSHDIRHVLLGLTHSV